MRPRVRPEVRVGATSYTDPVVDMTYPLRATAGILALVLSAGCGDAGTVEPAPEDQLDQQREALEAAIQAGAGSSLERDVLADGFVSPAEADKTAADVIVCAEEQGVTVTASWDEGSRSMEFTTRLSADNASEIFDTCWDERYALVGDAIAIQYALTSDEIEALENGMIDCLASSGIVVTEWPSGDVTDLAIEAQCYDEVIPEI